MESIWNGIERPQFASLQGDTKTDVLVIGGGLCGILCAYMLKKAGVDCILAEADRICAGVTNGILAFLFTLFEVIQTNRSVNRRRLRGCFESEHVWWTMKRVHHFGQYYPNIISLLADTKRCYLR